MLMFNADELFERLGLTVNCEDCKRHNKDYINKCDNSTWMEVCDILDYMTPIDAEPVVRCKDCKWYVRSMIKQDGTLDKRYKPDWCDLYRRVREETYFCTDGERGDSDDE